MLVLWFRDGPAGLSILAVPASALSEATRSALERLDGLHLVGEDGAGQVRAVLQPLWPFPVGFAEEDQEQATEITARIDAMVCVRTP
jgi:hypothetical protein